MFKRKAQKRERVVDSRVEDLDRFAQRFATRSSEFGGGALGCSERRLRKHYAQAADDFSFARLRNVSEDVPIEVNLASLPRCTLRDRCNRALQSLMRRH